MMECKINEGYLGKCRNGTKGCMEYHGNSSALNMGLKSPDERWRVVPDEMPKPYCEVLVYYQGRISRGIWIERMDTKEMWDIEGNSGGIGTRFQVGPPSHWRPMVEPPEGV
jgi:hypothetical protein